MTKKLVTIIMCLLMLLVVFAGCVKPAAPDAAQEPATPGDSATPVSPDAPDAQTGSDVPAHKDELVIGCGSDINSLDVQAQSDQINNIILKCTHNRLVNLTNEATYEGGLAESWDWTDDTTLRIVLKPGITFHDGSPCTAEDVKFTLEMAKDSYASSYVALLNQVDVVDERTADLKLSSYSNEFIASLTQVPLSILSKKAYESGMKEPYLMGTGPFKLEEWVSGDQIVLTKVENCWDKGAVVNKIIFRPILEASARVIALQNGEIDVCIDPPINELQYLQDDENVTVFEKPGTRFFYFACNVTKKPWDNKALRQAVAYSLDRKTILDVALQGKGTLQTTVLNHGLFGWYDDMEGFPYDVEKAKAKMAEAGYPDGGIKTTLLVSGSPYTEIAQVVQANLAAIGIDAKIENVETAALKAACGEGTQELYLWRWNEDSMVDAVYRDLWHTGSGSNYMHFSDPYVDEAADKILSEKDQEKRKEMGIELQKYLVDQASQVPFYTANLVIAYNKNLSNTNLYGGGDHDWRYAYVAE